MTPHQRLLAVLDGGGIAYTQRLEITVLPETQPWVANLVHTTITFRDEATARDAFRLLDAAGEASYYDGAELIVRCSWALTAAIVAAVGVTNVVEVRLGLRCDDPRRTSYGDLAPVK